MYWVGGVTCNVTSTSGQPLLVESGYRGVVLFYYIQTYVHFSNAPNGTQYLSCIFFKIVVMSYDNEKTILESHQIDNASMLREK